MKFEVKVTAFNIGILLSMIALFIGAFVDNENLMVAGGTCIATFLVLRTFLWIASGGRQ